MLQQRRSSMHATQRLDYSVGETALVGTKPKPFLCSWHETVPVPRSLAWRWRQHIAASLEPPLLQRTVCVSCPAFPCNWMDSHMPSYIQFPVLGRQACMVLVPPKARRLPGLPDCRAEKCSMGQGARQLGRQTRPSCQTGEEKASKGIGHTFLFRQCCLSPASCASATQPAPHTAKRRHSGFWTISSHLSLSLSHFMFFYH